MGIFKRASPEPEALQLLDPVSPPLEVVRGYVRNEQTTLEISKKLLTLTEVGPSSRRRTDPRKRR